MSIFKDRYDDVRIGWVMVMIFTGVVGIIILLGVGVTLIDKHYQHKYCQSRLEQMNREGKWVEYNFWSYDCLAKTSKGTYLPIDVQVNNTNE